MVIQENSNINLNLNLISAIITFAFFSYTKEGTTENTVTTGTITFLYTEIDQVGAGISLTNAFPISDSQGKALTGDNEVFDFKITSNTPSNSNIPYEITARKKIVENMLDEEAVRIYLTKNNGTEEEILLDNYSNLTQTTKVSKDKYIEKTLHTDKVTAGTNYEQAYRLRMWVDESVDFSPVKDEQGNDTYPYNGKEFTVTINVYANAKVVTEEEISLENSTTIKSINISNREVTKVEGQNYDYEVNVDPEATEVTFTVETENEDATIEVTKLDSLAYNSKTNIQRLSAKKIITLPIAEEVAYYQIKVTSESKKEVSTSIIKVTKREYQLESKDYTVGESVIWANQEWYVISDNGKETTLELKTNYETGAYGESEVFEGSTAYTKVNEEFIASNEIIQKAINEGSLVSQGTYNGNSYYVRLPEQSELSASIPNDSETAFWTKTANESNLYLGVPTGENADNYIATATGTYYGGYSTNKANIQKTSPTSVTSSLLSTVPTATSVTHNKSATTVNRPTAYSSQVNVTRATASGYTCSDTANDNCPGGAYCRSNGKTYYTDTCTTGSFTYSTVGSWYNPNYNVTVAGSSCGTNTIYYASGGCKSFYQLDSVSYDIGYRPVVTILEK